MKIAFLGGGNMASALIGGLIGKGADPSSIAVVEVSPAARERLGARYPVHIAAAPDAEMQRCEIYVLAVKPQDAKAALASIAGTVQGKLLISIAAGVTLETLSRRLGGHRKLVRCMPNTPSLIGAGIAGLYAAPGVNDDEKAAAESILAAVGEVVWVPQERLLDPVTAVSASGPAYVFWFIEQLAAAAEKLGLSRDTSMKLALHTVLGAARLAASSSDTPATLRKNVTSKGGTTEAALKVLDEEKLAERFMRAVQAASRRATELGTEQGRD
ncbi:MAG TPA: pyrroline-5-carboxylate reductase [Burkholderiales bacterium]|nr:pyrroline-5-carboxylate reductase [Burkholderiales bacterium]